MIFLDWEKVFDRISHQRLFEALERMKINAKMINNIKALYEHPFFKTIHNTEESKWKKNKQHSGIRQGCPLSLLFIQFNDEGPVLRCEAQEQRCVFPENCQQHEVSKTFVRRRHSSHCQKHPNCKRLPEIHRRRIK